MHPLSFKRFLVVVLFSLLFLGGCSSVNDAASTLETVANTAVTQISSSPEPTSPALTAVAQPEIEQPALVQTQSSPQPQTPNTALDIALAQELAFINIYEQVNPSVVNISVGVGQGSGFVYDNEGHIVTNNHVVAGARQVQVFFTDGTILPATVIGTDPSSDLAVIKVNAAGVPAKAVELGDSDALRVGQIVAAIGSPFGLESSMTTGIISALNRLYPGAAGPDGSQFNIPDIIQTDAAINPGNSGGPLLDLNGRVIGVNSAIESPVRGSSGIGYAIPANIVRTVVPQLIQNGQVQHPWLGISGGNVTPNNAAELGVTADQRGVFISSVIPGGPAAQAGLQAAGSSRTVDIIVGVNDQPITTFDDLLGYVVQHTVVGQTIDLQIIRDGTSQTVPLTLQTRPSGS